VELMKKSCERASGFIHGIKEQTRDPEEQESRLFEVRPVIEDALALLKNALHANRCEAEIAVRGAEPRLFGVPNRLALAVTNILLNAIEAESPAGGRIAVEVERQAREVLLRVIDTGRGIPQKDLPRIFEPLFTARSFSEGTGLGLTVAHDIVCGEFGGRIWAESPGGRGAVFTMGFPCRASPRKPRRP